jgi:hypothetical protein
LWFRRPAGLDHTTHTTSGKKARRDDTTDYGLTWGRRGLRSQGSRGK